MLVFITLLTWIAIIISKYYRFQTTMAIKIMDKPVPFPEVTICDAKQYDMFTMDSILLADHHPELQQQLCASNGTKCEREMIGNIPDDILFQDVKDVISRRYWIKKYISLADISEEKRDYLRSKLNSVISFAVTLGERQWKKLGQQAQHMIASCSYGGRPCDYRNWTHKPDQSHGSCFTFTPKTVSGSKKNLYPGEQYGLIVVLFLPSDTLMGYADGIYDFLDKHNPIEFDGNGDKVIVISGVDMY